MPCYHPLHGWKRKYPNPTGKHSIVFRLGPSADQTQPASVPCGKCIGCRLERSRQWAMRGVHEASLHEDNSSITLTYAPEHLPVGGTLIRKDFVDFMKRLRRRRPPESVRVLYCGEYGERKRRPHYHAILFGVRFPDQQLECTSPAGELLYSSAELSELWPVGRCLVGDASFEAIAYVARYVVKKLDFYGEDAYEHIDPETGEVHPLAPEFNGMSLKPAIAKDWYRAFKSDVFPSDEVVVRGKVMKPPKYYDRLLEIDDLAEYERIKADRKEAALTHAADSTKARLRARERVKQAQTSLLKRTIE